MPTQAGRAHSLQISSNPSELPNNFDLQTYKHGLLLHRCERRLITSGRQQKSATQSCTPWNPSPNQEIRIPLPQLEANLDWARTPLASGYDWSNLPNPLMATSDHLERIDWDNLPNPLMATSNSESYGSQTFPTSAGASTEFPDGQDGIQTIAS
ncbi:hypothetical protein CIHG_03694 [Coccidioides immitis H538.4]|uniref:Uncharacterized protein n=1 Tax=Coccidioides immitis H538.4 TaxID=396776 RepID=A0A0J8RNU7_COCIT|nr:hypothetical protein CIHG_03694 [Coccidioides immitis H538.4]